MSQLQLQTQLQFKELKKLIGIHCHHRKHGGTLPMNVDLDGPFSVSHKHVAICDTIEPIAKVLNHKRS